MNGPHSTCIYRMGVVGDRCRHWGEESGKKSTVEGDQRHKQQCKRWTALRRRHASPGSLSVGEQLVGLPELWYISVWCVQLEVHGLQVQAELRFCRTAAWRVQMKEWGRPTKVYGIIPVTGRPPPTTIGVMHTVRGARTTSWAAVLDCLTCAIEGMRKTDPGGWYHWEYKVRIISKFKNSFKNIYLRIILKF